MNRAVLVVALVLALLLLGTPASAAPSAVPGTAPVEPCGTPGTPTTTVFLPNITKTLGGPSGWVTPFIVQNVGTRTTAIEVSFFRFSDGALVACRKIGGLAPGTSFADVPNNDADLPHDTQFAVVVRSFGAQVVSVVNEHQGLGTPDRAEALSYVGLTTGATTIYLPFVGKPALPPCTAVPASDSVCDYEWLTTFVMQNFGAADATVTARFVSYDGATTVTLSRVVAPGRSRFIDPSVEPTIPKGRYYAVTLTSTQPIGVVANAHDDMPTAVGPASDPRAFSYNGVAQPSPGESFLPQVRRNTMPIRTVPAGVFIQNAGPADATPVLTAQRLGGGPQIAITAPAPIKPGSVWHFDPDVYAVVGGFQLCFIAGPGKCIEEGENSLIVSGGSFATLALTLTPKTAMGYTGALAQGNRAYLPNVTRTLGGTNGWSTPIVLQSSGATAATLRWYRFSDGTLILRQPVGPFARGAAIRIDPREVPALADDTQYAVIADAQGGNLTAIVTELNFQGGDGTMEYEGFAATVSTFPVPTVLSVSPSTVGTTMGWTTQLTPTVKDQFDNVLAGRAVFWSVEPPTLGAVSPTGVFTAGNAATSGTITARSGDASATVAVVVNAPVTRTVGGIAFVVTTTAVADLFTETTITAADTQTIAIQIESDVPRIEQDYARRYTARPELYVEATTSTYTTAQSAILGIPPAQVIAVADLAQSAGVFYRGRIAIDWSQIRSARPITVPRHELTHMMIDEITPHAFVPAWLNEGSARLEEFTVPDAAWRQALARYAAVSMAANGQLLSIPAMTSQFEWNARPTPAGEYQYYEAAQAVQLVRDEVGLLGVIRILERLEQGESFDEAYAAVSGRTAESFAATLPSRILALAPPRGIAFAPDAFLGTTYAPTYIVYGFAPGSTVTITITSPATSALTITRQVDQYGVYWNSLSPQWPLSTYTFSVTGSGATFTATFTKTR